MTENDKWKSVRDEVAAVNPDIILYDGLEEAFIGLCRRFNQEPIALYDYHKCIEIRMRDGGTYEECVEFHEFNTMGCWLGDLTPAFLVRLEEFDELITDTDMVIDDDEDECDHSVVPLEGDPSTGICTKCGDDTFSISEPCPHDFITLSSTTETGNPLFAIGISVPWRWCRFCGEIRHATLGSRVPEPFDSGTCTRRRQQPSSDDS